MTFAAAVASAAGAMHAALACAPRPVFDWTILLGPAIVLLSASIAFYGVLTAKSIARKRATLDFIEKVESIEHYRKLAETFSRMRTSAGFSKLHTPTSDAEHADRRSVFDYINQYELVSIGIAQKILDEKFYRQWMASAFVRDWNTVSDFVQRERWKWNAALQTWEYADNLFDNFQTYACRWSKQAVALNKASSQPPPKAQGVGDQALPELATHGLSNPFSSSGGAG